jgi:hypothetical protein
MKRRLSGVVFALSMALGGAWMLTAQGNPPADERPVTITTVPPAGAGGPDKTDLIAGKVSLNCDDCNVVLFAKGGDMVWYVQPLADAFNTPIVDGEWHNTTHLGLEYAALLAKPGYIPPAKTTVLPREGGEVVAATVVAGRK